MPTPTRTASAKPLAGTWQLAQLTMPPRDRALSKNRVLPRAISCPGRAGGRWAASGVGDEAGWVGAAEATGPAGGRPRGGGGGGMAMPVKVPVVVRLPLVTSEMLAQALMA